MVPDPVPQQYPEPPAPVRAVHIGDETVIVLDQGFALVASKTEPDVWHVVEQGRCSCPGYRYRESCRHTGIVQAVQAAATIGVQGAVKKGDRPPTWGGVAIMDGADLEQPPTEDPTAADTELARIFGKLAVRTPDQGGN
jgi:hypothetical protein